ncbi:phage tail protein [Microvirga sp. STS02]|uniref:phage tail protein n=1 Tax=Hymenobacter negativus TaxID=2795026 RepID=UPI0018DC633C|nr:MULTISPECIES: tail fiber protein [Bacteria]MBH8567413.1 phage tail protein [Hymenobacter negativus]MBR7207145.1 phage tail protein [Microvirga sp. STS02]
MSTPYIGQVIAVGFNFAPVGYVACNGQLLQIAEYETLFTLIGTTYGGDGITTFAVPNMNGRLAVGAQGQGPGLSSYPLGTTVGTENVTLTTSQLPVHGHTANAPLQAVTTGTASAGPVGKFPATSPIAKPYAAAATAGATLSPQALTATLGVTGGSQPHSNLQPSLAMNFIISTEGIYPPQP